VNNGDLVDFDFNGSFTDYWWAWFRIWFWEYVAWTYDFTYIYDEINTSNNVTYELSKNWVFIWNVNILDYGIENLNLWYINLEDSRIHAFSSNDRTFSITSGENNITVLDTQPPTIVSWIDENNIPTLPTAYVEELGHVLHFSKGINTINIWAYDNSYLPITSTNFQIIENDGNDTVVATVRNPISIQNATSPFDYYHLIKYQVDLSSYEWDLNSLFIQFDLIDNAWNWNSNMRVYQE